MVNVTLLPSRAGRAALLQAQQPVAAPILVRMLIDTGADQTAIEEGLLLHWGLPYSNMGWGTSMGSGQRPIKKYELSVLVSSANNHASWDIEPLLVSAWKTRFDNGAYVGLLGRDVLDKALFVYNGAANSYTLAF